MDFSGKKAYHCFYELGGEPAEQTRLENRVSNNFRQNFFSEIHSYIIAQMIFFFKS